MQNSTVATVIVTETSSELTSARPMFCWSSAFTMFENSSGPGVSGGGLCAISAIGLLAATSR